MHGCSRRVLAAGDFAIVEECSCGSVHLTIGAVTLRLAADALPAVASVLGEAARTLVLGRALHARTLPHEALS
jgi:hypothetical protein